MKKVLSILVTTLVILAFANYCSAASAPYKVTPKAPKVTPALKPIIVKYKKGNYIGSMQDLEELIKKEKNNMYAKYYLALCYTRLGYKDEATSLYKEIVKKDENLALSYYSQRALDCIENPKNPSCNPKAKQVEDYSGDRGESTDDIEEFIRSGKPIHPNAMDRITRERMERKLQETEYMRMQQQHEMMNQGQFQSYKQPTNEEIANALNTLSKAGMNPYNNQYNPLAYNQQINQFGAMGLTNPNMYSMFLGNSNQEAARMFLYNQMTQQQNNMLNYGI